MDPYEAPIDDVREISRGIMCPDTDRWEVCMMCRAEGEMTASFNALVWCPWCLPDPPDFGLGAYASPRTFHQSYFIQRNLRIGLVRATKNTAWVLLTATPILHP